MIENKLSDPFIDDLAFKVAKYMGEQFIKKLGFLPKIFFIRSSKSPSVYINICISETRDYWKKLRVSDHKIHPRRGDYSLSICAIPMEDGKISNRRRREILHFLAKCIEQINFYAKKTKKNKERRQR